MTSDVDLAAVAHNPGSTTSASNVPWLLNEKAVGCEIVQKMAEIGGMVRQAGWGDWWEEGMKPGA
jgi:hypothetical protein